jgi:hypothetical protein
VHATELDTTAPPSENLPTRARKVSTCSICHKTGHTKPRCPDRPGASNVGSSSSSSNSVKRVAAGAGGHRRRDQLPEAPLPSKMIVVTTKPTPTSLTLIVKRKELSIVSIYLITMMVEMVITPKRKVKDPLQPAPAAPLLLVLRTPCCGAPQL